MTNQKIETKVIVIGAGIAGLTAAWQLKRHGIEVIILEADQVVGGRMKSIQFEDAIIDCGAQFLSSAYSIIPELIKEAGLDNQVIATSEWVGLVSNTINVIHTRRPWHLLTKNILSSFDFIRLAFNQFRFFNVKNRLLSLNDITEWTQYDNELASSWMTRNFGKSVSNEFISTMLNGFYFQSLNTSSTSLICPVLAFSAHKPKTMTLMDGIGTLPQKLAEYLNVKTEVSVSSISETDSSVEVISSKGMFIADHVILTVPAPIAKKIVKNPDREMLLLFETPYSTSTTISLLVKEGWNPPSNISKVYGFLVNPQLENKLAALTIENNKCATRKNRGYLVNVMLCDQWAKKLIHLTDEMIITEIKSDVEVIFPDIFKHIHAIKLFRWPHAMPYTPVGRAKAVKEYRDSRSQNNRLWLAGDYLGLPWTDSAAETGQWAAKQVVNRFK